MLWPNECDIVCAVLSGFVAALAAPWLFRLAPKRTGLLLSALPLVLFVYFLKLVGPVAKGERLVASYPWATELGIRFSFQVDGLSLLFALLISGIGFLILIYSSSYIGQHPQAGRFYAYLLMFMGSMLGLVLADDLIVLFVFWELTSLSSYFLIGFEHEKEEARQAAWQALLVTAFGGLAFLGGAVLMNLAGGSFSLSELSARGDLLRADWRYEAMLLLVLTGAFTKSAQFPFHFWLPNAMAAPTPVSAYLHSATMVKAGIYLLARLSPLLGGTASWEFLVTTFGAITLLAGASLALLATDYKRMLAYLTVSALGLLAMLLGIGTTQAVKACMVFLMAHAFYKGALFMVAGAVDHETGTRDLRRLGGLRRAMPITTTAACLAALSLASFGPVLSFMGKELTLEAALHADRLRFLVVPATVVGAAVFVAGAGLAGFRPFFGASPTPAHHEAPAALWAGPLLLAGLGVVFGVHPRFLQATLGPAVSSVIGQTEAVELALWHGFNLPLALSLVSVIIGLLLYAAWEKSPGLAQRLRPVLARGPERWYELSLASLLRLAVFQTRVLQSGYLRLYILTIVLFAASLTAWALLGRQGWRWAPVLGDWRLWDFGVVLLILLAAATVTRLQTRLAVIAALSVVGYGTALIFVLFGAPDLAVTQFLVETLVLVLLVVAFYRLPQFAVISSKQVRLRDLTVALVFGGLVATMVLGAASHFHGRELAHFYAERSVPEAKGRNVVNVILVDFRALDTLGEITVLVTAAVGVFALLRLRPAKEEK